MKQKYNRFSCIPFSIKIGMVSTILFQGSAAQAQLLSLGDVIANVAILNTQVTSVNGVVNSLSAQTASNAAAVTQLGYDLSVITAQVASNGTVVAGVDGRLATVEGILPPVVARTTALEAGVTAQANNIAANTSAIAANAATGTANTAAIAAGVLRNDAQDVTIAANAAVGVSNTAAIGVNTSAIAANVVRDDGQDAAINASASVGVSNAAAIAVNASAIVANVLRNDAQDTAIAVNASAIAATVLRDDGQDVAIATNAAAIGANTGAIATLDGRVTAHDVTLVQQGASIAAAAQTAVAAQAATATLRGDVVAGRVGLVQQTPAGVITVGAQTGGAEVSLAGTAGDRRISGVADGVGPGDAANVGQVAQSEAQAVSAANAYTDRTLANIVGRYDDHTLGLIAQNNTALRREMNAAAASTAAISSLPHSIVPGEGMGAIGIGGRGDAVAFAIGMSKAFKADHTPIVRAGAALDANSGTVSYNASVGVHF